MTDRYLQLIADVEGKELSAYQCQKGEKAHDTLIASAIFFCFLDGITHPKTISKKINETIEDVQRIYNNLTEAGYISNNKIVFHVKGKEEKDWKREYYLFSVAGLGVIKKI